MSDLESIGMDPRLSISVYPRPDTQYKNKGSLNFDIIRTKIFKERPLPKHHDLMVYSIYAMIAFATGLLAILINGAEDEFSRLKAKITIDIMGVPPDNMMWLAWIFFTLFSMGIAFCSAVLIVYVAP